jgi:hypothetical protein
MLDGQRGSIDENGANNGGGDDVGNGNGIGDSTSAGADDGGENGGNGTKDMKLLLLDCDGGRLAACRVARFLLAMQVCDVHYVFILLLLFCFLFFCVCRFSTATADGWLCVASHASTSNAGM